MNAAAPRSGPVRLLGVCAALLSVFAVHAIWVGFGENLVAYGNLFDGDSYARLIRVRRLYETGAWFDISVPRLNAPYGGALHWTRPLDVLILVPAVIASVLVDFETALYWAGALSGPALHAVLALSILWAGEPLIGWSRSVLAAVLSAFQFPVLGYATLGNADHHVLFAILAVLALGAAIRLHGDTTRHAAYAGACGLLLAVIVWVGPEGLMAAACIFFAFGATWIMGAAQSTRTNLAIAATFLAGLAGAVLVERGPGFFEIGYDRVSIVHVTLALLLTLFWAGINSAGKRGSFSGNPLFRTVLAGTGAAVVGAVMLIAFPGVVRGPLADMHPDIMFVFGEILEFQAVPDLAHFLTYLGGGAVALVWAVHKTRLGWANGDRRPWFLLALFLAFYGLLAVTWIRASIYVGALSCLALADLAAGLDGAIRARFSGLKRSLILVSALTLVLAGPLGFGAAGIFVSLEEPDTTGDPAPYLAPDDPRFCPVKRLSGYLEGPPWNTRRHLVLASANFGPELVYRTRHAVTASMHHRNAAGILDNLRILGATSQAEALSIVEKRGIDLIVICHFGRSGGYIRGRGDTQIIYRRLIESRPPAWLEEVTLPEDLAKSFRLYQVDRDAAVGTAQ